MFYAPVLSFKVIADIVLSHQERYDGTGYPHRLKEKNLPGRPHPRVGRRARTVINPGPERTDGPPRPHLAKIDMFQERGIDKTRLFCHL